MKSLSANEVKTQFGDVLLSVQREPVQINRNGKPVAVMHHSRSPADILAMRLHEPDACYQAILQE
ncbi:type II toxin-antitoxin system Phd/YefM family antitoxin [Rahnella woolbedingensis]|uniref:Antitoxin n=1 Tax=Rahnella woolbedingensis TaxID=1510574 RepID=A0A419N977_9GAMM|nr:type II toxin-antitoxin system Phd/YefM family antitoxin [Rahnella woolbedingensis]